MLFGVNIETLVLVYSQQVLLGRRCWRIQVNLDLEMITRLVHLENVCGILTRTHLYILHLVCIM